MVVCGACPPAATAAVISAIAKMAGQARNGTFAKFKPDCPFANPSMSAMAVHIPLDFIGNPSIGVTANGGLHDCLPAPPR